MVGRGLRPQSDRAGQSPDRPPTALGVLPRSVPLQHHAADDLHQATPSCPDMTYDWSARHREALARFGPRDNQRHLEALHQAMLAPAQAVVSPVASGPKIPNF
jgi:hypothetical protein